MSSEPAITASIEAHNLSKTYAIFDRPQDRLKQLIFRARRKYYREFQALSDVSFSISRGETVGIVGRNGSGKSTLLQLLCGTLRPTSGSAVVHGRIAALLELGAGFNPEFTGRENVFLNASVLGMRDEQIRERFHLIESFAAIGDFLDQPVKKYSSGMFARLAFAVAINVDPDILIVDEALSVGDEAFQRKCFSRIEELRSNGTTILFVSHSAGTIVELCDRAILLHRGRRLLTGSPRDVVGLYQKLSYAPPEKEDAIIQEIVEIDSHNSRCATVDESVPVDRTNDTGNRLKAEPSGSLLSTNQPLNNASSGLASIVDTGDFDPSLVSQSTVSYHSQGAQIRDAGVYDLQGRPRNVLVQGQEYELRYTVAFSDICSRVRFGMLLKTTTGNELGGLISHSFGHGIETLTSENTVEVSFKIVARLSAGTYFLNAGVMGWVAGAETYLHRVVDILMVRILPRQDQLITSYVDFSGSSVCSYDIRGLGDRPSAIRSASAS